MESFLTPYGLSNSGQEKLQFTPFWGGPKPVSSDGLRAGTIESHNFFILGPILVKFHIRTLLFERFQTFFRTWWCGKKKVVLDTSSHLMPTEAWRSPDSTTSEGRRVSSEVRFGNCSQVWGWAKFEERGSHGWGKIALHTCSDLPRLVRTYAQHSDHVRSSRSVIFCTFERSCSSVLRRPILLKLHILTRLIESLSMVYELWRCIEIKLSIL